MPVVVDPAVVEALEIAAEQVLARILPVVGEGPPGGQNRSKNVPPEPRRRTLSKSYSKLIKNIIKNMIKTLLKPN